MVTKTQQQGEQSSRIRQGSTGRWDSWASGPAPPSKTKDVNPPQQTILGWKPCWPLTVCPPAPLLQFQGTDAQWREQALPS